MIHEMHESDGSLTLLRFERLAASDGLVHAVASRPHNYAPHRGTERDRARDARRALCEKLGLSFERLTAPAQVMGAEVLPILPDDVGRGRDGRDAAIPFVDGLVCDIPGVPLMLLSADCPLIAVYDPDRPAVGAVHASWQGTLAGGAGNLIRQMQRVFGSDPAQLSAAIAPSAGPCCYEVGPEVRRLAETRWAEPDRFVFERGSRHVLDLWAANRAQLIEAGLQADSIECAGPCTICDDRFWSHRRQGADAGRTALILALRG